MRASLSESFHRSAREELGRTGIDGWLLYDLEARNRVAAELVGLPEGLSRRWFVLLRPDAPPRALAHRIELSHWESWSHQLEPYVGWREMEGALGRMLEGCRTVAMEVSPRDNVPFLDNVPAGVVELVESFGVEVVGSAPLVSRTYAQWGETGRRLHERAAEILARTAREAFGVACRSVAEGAEPLTEGGLAAWIRSTLEGEGLTEAETIVAVGPNSAKPHYFPSDRDSAPLEAEGVLLIDLWGRVAGEPEAVFADQTWMGFLGAELPADVAAAWEAVRDARDAGVERIRAEGPEGFPTGAEVDLRVREVLEERGFAEAIFHRTGHAMDRVNHGFGPNLDAVETRDDRRLVPGIGFSVEPGLYFEGRFGLRSEINVYLTADGPVVTTPAVQDWPWMT